MGYILSLNNVINVILLVYNEAKANKYLAVHTFRSLKRTAKTICLVNILPSALADGFKMYWQKGFSHITFL